MIESKFNNATLPDSTPYTSVEFEQMNLVCYRLLPFAFNLTSTSRAAMAKDVRIFYTQDVSEQGCYVLVGAMRDWALSNVEIWNSSQLQAVAGTKTLYICYTDASNVFLNFDKEFKTLEQLQDANPESVVFVNHTISDVGLVTLVNEYLNWMVSEFNLVP